MIVEPLRNLSDEELAGLLCAGDREAFAEIFERYNGLLYLHACKKIVNKEEARDIVQEVFANLWSNRETFVLKSNLPGLLYTSVYRKILDRVAREKSYSRYADHLQHYLRSPEADTDHLVRERQLSQIIEREIAALPPKMRVVFELSRKQHYNYKEIAAELDISEETVRSQIKNALKILRVKLGIFTFLLMLLGH